MPRIHDAERFELGPDVQVCGRTLQGNRAGMCRGQRQPKDTFGVFRSIDSAYSFIDEFGCEELPMPSERELVYRNVFGYMTETGVVEAGVDAGSPFTNSDADNSLAVPWDSVEAAVREVMQSDKWVRDDEYNSEWLTLVDCGAFGYVLHDHVRAVLIAPLIGAVGPTVEPDETVGPDAGR